MVMSVQEAATILTFPSPFTCLISKRIELVFVCWPPVVKVYLCSCCCINHVQHSGFPIPAVSPLHWYFFHWWFISPTVVYMRCFWGKAKDKHTGLLIAKIRCVRAQRRIVSYKQKALQEKNSEWRTERKDIECFIVILKGLLSTYFSAKALLIQSKQRNTVGNKGVKAESSETRQCGQNVPPCFDLMPK